MYTHVQMDTFLNLTNPLPVIYLGLRFVVALLLADETEKNALPFTAPIYITPAPCQWQFHLCVLSRRSFPDIKKDFD